MTLKVTLRFLVQLISSFFSEEPSIFVLILTDHITPFLKFEYVDECTKRGNITGDEIKCKERERERPSLSCLVCSFCTELG